VDLAATEGPPVDDGEAAAPAAAPEESPEESREESPEDSREGSPEESRGESPEESRQGSPQESREESREGSPEESREESPDESREESPDESDQRPRRWLRRLAEILPFAAVLALGCVVLGRLVAANVLDRRFFIDEGWRAYFASLPGPELRADLPVIDTPLSWGFLGLSRLATQVFGNTESGLRLTVLPLLPLTGAATYLLARLVGGRLAALVLSTALVGETGMVLYATFYKQYVGEALATALVLLLWYAGWRRQRPDWIWLAATAVAGALAGYATTAALILVPLAAVELAVGAARVVRARSWRPVPLLAAGWRPVVSSALLVAPAAVHAAVWLRPQTGKLTTSPTVAGYWFFAYPPRHGSLLVQLRWVGRMLHTFVPGVVVNGYPQPRDIPVAGIPHAHASVGGTVVAAGVVLMLVAGAAAARRSVLVRVLLAVLLGALLLMYVLARRREWPFIWGRTSLFLLPLGYAIAAAGVSELWRWLRGAAGVILRPGAGWRRAAAGIAAAGAAAGLLLCAAGAVVAARASVRDQAGIVRDLPDSGHRLREAAALVRRDAGPGDLVVSELQGRPLSYYLLYYEGYGAPSPLRPENVTATGSFDSPQTIEFVQNHPDATQVWVFQFVGISGRSYQAEVTAMRRLGFVPRDTTQVHAAGILTRYVRGATAYR
jgi:hypothetical protein